MNSQSVIIELREKETPVSYQYAPGDYEVILNDNSLSLQNGDSISINQTFIDTAPFPTNNIVIPRDSAGKGINIEIDNYVYISKWLGNARATGTGAASINTFGMWNVNSGTDATNFDASALRDGKPYILCNQSTTGALAGYKRMDFFRFSAIGNRSGFNLKYGGYEITFQYKTMGPQGTPINAIVNVSLPKRNNVKGDYIDIPLGIIYQENNPTDISKDIVVIAPTAFKIEKNGGRITFPYAGDALTTSTYTPRLFKGTYYIPPGNYTPNQLCKTINDQLQNNYGGGKAEGAGYEDGPWNKSQFLKGTDSQASQLGLGVPGLYSSIFWDMERNSILNFQVVNSATEADGVNLWCGASQMELSFNADTNKFFWEYLHTPIYTANEESVGVAFTPDGTGAPPVTNAGIDMNLYYSNSGVILSGLHAYDSFNNPVEFWFSDGILKFNPEEVLAPFPTYEVVPPANGAYSGTSKPSWITYKTAQFVYPVEDRGVGVGLNMTGGYIGNDNVIVKSYNLTTDYGTGPGTPTNQNVGCWECPPIPIHAALAGGAIAFPYNPIFSTVSATFPVIAQEPYFAVEDIDAYYLIEIDAKFKNNYLTSSTNIRSMNQVVGKFYTKGSFTQSGGGGFVYEHKGDPLMLSSFRVRILKPNKTLATDIGTDSTVFLSINRGPSQAEAATSV